MCMRTPIKVLYTESLVDSRGPVALHAATQEIDTGPGMWPN